MLGAFAFVCVLVGAALIVVPSFGAIGAVVLPLVHAALRKRGWDTAWACAASAAVCGGLALAAVVPWAASLYDPAHGGVSLYARSLVASLPPGEPAAACLFVLGMPPGAVAGAVYRKLAAGRAGTAGPDDESR